MDWAGCFDLEGSEFSDDAEEEAVVATAIVEEEVVGEVREVVSDAQVDEAMDVVGDLEEESVIENREAERFSGRGLPGPEEAVLNTEVDSLHDVEIQSVDPQDCGCCRGLETYNFLLAELHRELFDDLEPEGQLEHRDQREHLCRRTLHIAIGKADGAEFLAVGVLHQDLHPIVANRSIRESCTEFEEFSFGTTLAFIQAVVVGGCVVDPSQERNIAG